MFWGFVSPVGLSRFLWRTPPRLLSISHDIQCRISRVLRNAQHKESVSELTEGTAVEKVVAAMVCFLDLFLHHFTCTTSTLSLRNRHRKRLVFRAVSILCVSKEVEEERAPNNNLRW